jgi:hypothetical protein
VTVDIIASEGEVRVKDNMARKAAQADEMFAQLVANMHRAIIENRNIKHVKPKLPSFI